MSRQRYFLMLPLLLSACCQNNLPPAPNMIQDTAKAAHYFQEEMNYNINPYSVHRAVTEKHANVTIVDVRAAKDYAKGHIPGAVNIPYEKWNTFEGNETEFPGLRRDGFNYVYCYELLCNLAQKAARKFALAGYPVKEMKGGFEAWKAHNYPIEK